MQVAIGELYCNDREEWYFEKAHVTDSRLIDIREDLYDYYKDQGYMLDNNDEPNDDLYELDKTKAALDHDKAEKLDDEESDCKV